MNDQNPHDPQNTDTAWEAAMSRDFDARVRDLHEAPLDFHSVKGKAHKIRRNRRAAVAGGVLGVAAVITPVAVLAGGNGDQKAEVDFADPTETTSDAPVDPTAGVDYVLKGVWHQADGDTVALPDNTYDAAVLWNGQLVATRFDGEVYYDAVVVAEDGTVADSFRTTQTVAVNEAGTTLAWIDPDTGDVMTAWDGGEVSMGNVDLAAAGEGIAYFTGAVTGGPDCNEEAGGCTVYVISGLGTVESFDSHGVNDSALEQYQAVRDVSGGRAVVQTDVTDFETCSAVVDVASGEASAETCDYQLREISPDGSSIAAPPSYYDGLGPTSISIVDTAGNETGRFAPEGGFIGSWGWSTDSRLVFDTYDGANWHLMAMEPDGALTEIGEPVKGNEFDSPFAVIQH